MTSRRDFLRNSAAGTIGILVPFKIVACAEIDSRQLAANQLNSVLEGFIQVTQKNEIFFVLPRDEMGQGVIHGLTTLVAEELNVEINEVNVEFAPVHKDYENPGYGAQGTWGSSSVREHFLPIRQAAANLRESLLSAASKRLNTSIENLKLRDGKIANADEFYPLGEFVDLASRMPIPKNAALKPSTEFRHIGRISNRIDSLSKVTGKAIFGIDFQSTELYRACVVHSPVLGAKVESLNDEKAKLVNGVISIFTIPSGVAVVAEHIWQAKKAARLLKVTWSNSTLDTFDSSEIKNSFLREIDRNNGAVAHKAGKGKKGIKGKEAVLESIYSAPYLAHATMEPMNCTVSFKENKCSIWTGTQAPEFARDSVAKALNLKRENVVLHNHTMGGGFGRRVGSDFIIEAANIAKQMNRPVQLIWSREDDTKNDYYRPASVARFMATLDDSKRIKTFVVERAGPNILPSILPEALPSLTPEFTPNFVNRLLVGTSKEIINNWYPETSSLEGMFEDYSAEHVEALQYTIDPGLRTGYWRAVGHSISGFFKESFIDELAHESGLDPLTFRLMNAADEKLKNVLRLVAEKANWHQPTEKGRFRGIALHRSLGTTVAQVAEVSIKDKQILVHSVTCVIDCGLVINPDIVKAQIEGGIIFGLTAALKGIIDIKQGRVMQSNFHDYPLLRYSETPDIKVDIVDSKESPTGVGEPGVPPVAAAVANAVFAATGKRLRDLPLRL